MKLKLVLAIADCIRDAHLSGRPFAPDHVARLADLCARHHHGFDRAKWLEYIARP